MKHFILLIAIILAAPFAYGMVFYSPQMNPHGGTVYDVVEANTPYVVDVKNPYVAVSKITFIINRSASNAGITVYELKTLDKFMPNVSVDEAYAFLELKYSGFVPFDTKSLVYEFKVEKSWLENMSISRDKIQLHLFDESVNAWEGISTKIVGDNDTYVLYAAEGKGAHYIMIGKSPSGAVSTAIAPEQPKQPVEVVNVEKSEVSNEVVAESKVTPAPIAQPAPVQPTVQKQEAPAVVTQTTPAMNSSEYFGIFAVTVLVIVIFVVYIIFSKKPSVSAVDRELHNYIKESLARGKTKDEVRHRLLEVGWHHERVDKAMAKHKDALPDKPGNKLAP